MNNSLKLILFLFLVEIGFNSCNQNDTPTVNNIQVNFAFNHTVGTSDLQFDTIIYTNAFGNAYSVSTLKYFISDIRLNRTDGSSHYFDMEHYVDGKDAGTMTFVPDQTIPAGEYSEVTFVFGLDSIKNVSGRFPDPPENNMEWPLALGEGYHYMKLEGKFDSTDLIKNYQAHTGPSKGNHYYIEVTLPNSSFTATNNQQTVQITMDINKWWVDPHTLDLNNMTMVMGNLQMQQTLHDNGENVFSFGGIN